MARTLRLTCAARRSVTATSGAPDPKADSATRGEGAFSLVELIVVVLIIGVLAAIAIPAFLTQRERAWDAAAQSDLRVVLVYLESYNSTYGEYSPDALVEPETIFRPSQGVEVTFPVLEVNAFCATSTHESSSNAWEITHDTGNVVPGDCSG